VELFRCKKKTGLCGRHSVGLSLIARWPGDD
jgi:hypothetical protein